MLNVSWEFAFAVLWPPPSRASRAVYRVWLVLDLGLLAQAFAWGSGDLAPGPLREHFQGLLVLGLFGAVSVQWLIYRRFRQPQLQAYVVNLAMSASFVVMFYARPDGEGLSIAVAVLKLLGTLCISTANVVATRTRLLEYPGRLVLFASVLVLDVSYLGLLLTT